MRTYKHLNRVRAVAIEALQNGSVCKFIALDIETTGLDPYKDEIHGIAFAIDEFTGYYTKDVDGVLKLVKEHQLVPVFHNALFDYTFLAAKGYDLPKSVHDTLALSHTLDADRDTYKLKDLARQFLGPASVLGADEMYAWLKAENLSKEDIIRAPEELLTKYAAEDAINTLCLFKLLCGKIRELQEYLKKHNIPGEPWKYYASESMPLIPLLADMYKRGVRLDVVKLLQEQSTLTNRLEDIKRDLIATNQTQVDAIEQKLTQRKHDFRMAQSKTKKIRSTPRVLFNWDSVSHLKELIYTAWGAPATKKTGKGNLSLDASVLEGLKGQLPWVSKLLEYRETQKTVSTYLTGLLERQNGGRIRSRFILTGTATGRFASRDPNLQNLPSVGNIKQLFIPDPGHVFVYGDYSQLELRIAAHLSNDPIMIKAYHENLDLHKITASVIFNIAQEQVVKEQRDLAKTTNFAIIYNASAWRVAEILGFFQGIPDCLTREQKCTCVACSPKMKAKRKAALTKADEIVQKLFGKYVGLKKYVDKQMEFMLRYKMSISPFGRLRRLRGIDSELKGERNHAIKAGFNLPIQSMGASFCKRAMLALADQGYNIVNQVHDAIYVQVKEQDAPSAMDALRNTMENIAQLRVPLVVEPKILTSFGE